MPLQPIRKNPSLSEETKLMGEKINRGVEKAISRFCKRKYGDDFIIHRLYENVWSAFDKAITDQYVSVELSPVPRVADYPDSNGYFFQVHTQLNLLAPTPAQEKDAEEFCREVINCTHIPINYGLSSLYWLDK